MKLDSRQFREVLSNLGREAAVFTEPPIHYREWLMQRRLPTELVEFLVVNAVSDIVPFPNGCGGMYPPRIIMARNDEVPEVLACGLFVVGSAINGDFIVVDLLEGTDQAGFVCHAEFFGNPGINVREIFVPVDKSLPDMLAGMSGELHKWIGGKNAEQPDDYPTDYYSALDRAENG
jgi:hypothetical protein